MFIKVVISCFEGVFDHLRDTYYYRRGVAGLAVLILWEGLSRLPTLIVFFMSVWFVRYTIHCIGLPGMGREGFHSRFS